MSPAKRRGFRPNPSRATRRRGYMLTEVVVAAIVLAVVISVVGQLAARQTTLRRDTRHYQTALEELTDQLDRLTALDDGARVAALANLRPSPTAAAILPSPELFAEEINDRDGRRVVMSLKWLRRGGSPPMTLVAWLPAEDDRPTSADTGDADTGEASEEASDAS